MTSHATRRGMSAVNACRIAAVLCLAVLGLDGRMQAKDLPAFVRKPALQADKDGVRISFEVSKATDVTVEVLSAEGKVVRHLAAGVLGPFAPPPLKADSLAQSLSWDGADDDGKPRLGREAVKVRVGLGLAVKYAGEYGGGYQPNPALPWDGRNIDGIRDLTVGPDGTLYVLGGWFHPHLDRFPHIIAVGRDGKYLREVYPPSAALLADKTPGLAKLKLADDSLIPQVESWWDLFIPELVESRRLVATGDGQLLVAAHSPDYVAERRTLLKLAADGSIPADARALKLPLGMATFAFSIAVSPDGKTLYVSGTATTRPAKALHVVHRLSLDGSNAAGVLFGQEGQSGADDQRLSSPAGVGVDKDGNVCVADYGNNRVVVVRPDGTLLRKLPVDKPFAVQADRKSGAIYALSADWNQKDRGSEYAIARRLVKFSPEGKEVSSTDVTAQGQFGYGKIPMRLAGMAVDSQADSPVIWLGGTSFPDGCNGYPYGYSYGLVKVTDGGTELGKAEFMEISSPVFEARRKAWSAPKPVQADGYRYGFIMRTTGDPSVVWMTRLDAAGKEVPFPAAGEQKWVATLGRRSSRHWFHSTVTGNGDILAEYYNWLGNDETKKYPAACVDLVGPDGAVKKRELVYGLHEGTYGLKVDRRGNVYVADHMLPVGRLGPAEVEAAFAANGQKVPETYVTTYGSVFKVSAGGGGFNWHQPPQTQPESPKTDLVRSPGAVWDPGGGRSPQASCRGIEWQFVGGSPLPATRGRCICSGIGFDLDDHGRVYVPDAYRMCVHVLDSGGNLVLRFGGYGNQDDARKQIAFARPRFVAAQDGRVTITDPQNGKATTVELTFGVEETCPVPSSGSIPRPQGTGG